MNNSYLSSATFKAALWDRYHAALAPLEAAGKLRRPLMPQECTHNAHMYYVLLNSLEHRTHVMANMKERGVNTVFHYVPLHSAPAGRAHSRTHGSMDNTDGLSERLLRLPLWVGLEDRFDEVVAALAESLYALPGAARLRLQGLAPRPR